MTAEYSYDRKTAASDKLNELEAYLKKLESLSEFLNEDLPEVDPKSLHEAYRAPVREAAKKAEKLRFSLGVEVGKLRREVAALHQYLAEQA